MLVAGVLTTRQTPAVVVPAMESLSGVNESAPLKAKLSKTSDDFPHQYITPTLVSPSLPVSTSSSSTSAAAFPVVLVPELATLAEAYPE